MNSKLKLAIIYGGANTEHEVSLQSAQTIIDHVNPEKYLVSKIKIEKDGSWNFNNQTTTTPPDWKQFDVVFPVLHGLNGEDGTIQGMLEMSHIPYVGCGVLASAICMDKVIQKQIVQTQNLPIVNYLWFTSSQWNQSKINLINQIKTRLKLPIFVKPANQGSSVGISKVSHFSNLEKAINFAFKFDTKVILEEAVNQAREIECAILGNENPKASILGEIIPSNEFYDYNAKYIDGKSKEIIPAKLNAKLTKSIQEAAIKAFKILNCSGLARTDFLLDNQTQQFFLNEVNTLPGFTSISMYPKLWQASGLKLTNLIDKLIELALEQHHLKSQLNFDFNQSH